MKMAQAKKSASQIAIVGTSKGKATAAGDTMPIDAHPFHPDVLIEDVGKGQSFSPTTLRVEANGYETRVPAKGQLLQLLASLQRQLDEQ